MSTIILITNNFSVCAATALYSYIDSDSSICCLEGSESYQIIHNRIESLNVFPQSIYIMNPIFSKYVHKLSSYFILTNFYVYGTNDFGENISFEESLCQFTTPSISFGPVSYLLSHALVKCKLLNIVEHFVINKDQIKNVINIMDNFYFQHGSIESIHFINGLNILAHGCQWYYKFYKFFEGQFSYNDIIRVGKKYSKTKKLKVI